MADSCRRVTPYDIPAAESCNPRHLGVTQERDPCTRRKTYRDMQMFAVGSSLRTVRVGHGMECATHIRPAGRGTFSKTGKFEWLNAKHFRSFHSVGP